MFVMLKKAPTKSSVSVYMNPEMRSMRGVSFCIYLLSIICFMYYTEWFVLFIYLITCVLFIAHNEKVKIAYLEDLSRLKNM